MKTPFISVRSFEEPWETGASVPGLSAALGQHTAGGKRGGGEPRGVLAGTGLSWLQEESAPCRLCTAKLTLPAQLLSSPAALLPHSPRQQWPFPTNCLLPCMGVPVAPLPPQHCPARNRGACSACTGNHKCSSRNHTSIAEKAFLSLFCSI